MLSFEERMAILDEVLAEHTPESLFQELSETPACGPSLASYCLEISEKVLLIEPSNLEVKWADDDIYSSEAFEYGEAA
ncbi:hypothetical protein AB4Y55_24320 [Serratia nematodiphila]